MDLFEFAQQGLKEKPSTEPIYTVSEITVELKGVITQRFGRENFWIKGEVSNFKGRNQSGHMYFRLKDDRAVLSCVYFRNANRNLNFELQEGLEVLALGRLDVWEKGGSYQLVVEELRPGGTGELYLRYEQLKKKLEAEGLFDATRKKALPPFSKRIGLVTSPTGAVVRDIIHVIRRRCPYVTLLLFPVKVQGEGSAHEIANAIKEINGMIPSVDVMIVGRGGGSIEDLWAFNEEEVARAISNSRIPVISAVGHQTDFTISDFVADLRAATPSQAAELVVPNMEELRGRVELLMRNMVRELNHQREVASGRLLRLQKSQVLRDPRLFVRERMQRLDLAIERMTQYLHTRRIEEVTRFTTVRERIKALLLHIGKPRRLRFEKIESNLLLLNPLSILARGYSVVTKSNGTILKHGKQAKKGEEINIRLHEGGLECQVTQIFKVS